ncbi:hypothetical protein [Micromonospora sp. NPDC007230]|uniref:hypothetical protein n=1 Tax=Micromonospora sp. NPDC007230 TaxID=3364237 RepID=UPI0036BCC1C8
MKMRRLATTGVALVAVLGLGLTGCGGRDGSTGRGTATASTSSTPDPTGELTAAVRRLNEQSMRVEVTSSMLTASGVVDPTTRAMDVTLSLGDLGEVHCLAIGDDAYVKLSGALGTQLGGAKKWLHMDAGKLSGGQLGLMPADDPGGVKKLLSAVVDVRRTGDRSYAGTLDYTRTGADPKSLAAAGDKAKAVPFTAAADEQGRLTAFEMDMAAIDPALGKMTVSYRDFGMPVQLSKPPAADTEEAPAELARAFTGGS